MLSAPIEGYTRLSAGGLFVRDVHAPERIAPSSAIFPIEKNNHCRRD